MRLTVVIPTHDPHSGRLQRTLAALRAQTLATDLWETVVVDNASRSPLDAALTGQAPANFRIVAEPQLGLTAARRRGLLAARGEFVVLVDDDNVITPDYLACVVRIFDAHPRVGAAGGPSRPEFESDPAEWMREFLPLLALRDLGAAPQVRGLERSSDGARVNYPECAPIGAGLALRREAAQCWLATSIDRALSDRRGGELTSAGDNDIVLTLLEHGWLVGYFPELSLTHLIPADRLDPAYLARLNRGIQKSWMQVLTKHGANPWPAVPAWTVPLRQGRAWFTHRAWSGPAAQIRWRGACGHFEGRVLA